MLNATLAVIRQNVAVSAVIVEILGRHVMSLAVEQIAIVQAIRLVKILNASILVFMRINVHQRLNVDLRITCLYAGAHQVMLEIHILLVHQNQHLSANMTPIVHPD